MLKNAVPWEWGDQGRSAYTHDFRNFCGIARGLDLHNGADVSGAPDTLKRDLQLATGLPFPPNSYTAWRNYGRIFRSLLLATEDAWHALQVTEVCRQLANPAGVAWTADDFLTFLTPRFYQPSPGRGGYAPGGPRVFPVCVLLRYLAVNVNITWQQTFDLLIGNSIEGNEPLATFGSLTSSNYAYTDAEKRQVREFMAFVAQFSFLSWDKQTLSLAPGVAGDATFKGAITSMATPISTGFLMDQDAEVMRLGRLPGAPLPQLPSAPIIMLVPMEKDDAEFAEGSPKARTHMARERDPRLRTAFFADFPGNAMCDVCGLTSEVRYPWTSAGVSSKRTIIELHHVLPLASAAHSKMTNVADLVPLCPSCHKAVHRYYLQWFKANTITDFPSKKAARDVYDEAKLKHQT